MNQIQLSDAQSIILSAACARGDGSVFPVTTSLKGGAVGNVCKSLLKRELIEEAPATDLNTVWRYDEERGPITLRATPWPARSLASATRLSPPHPRQSPCAAAAAPSRRR